MPDRFQDLEKYQARVRDGLQEVIPQWLGEARRRLERLTTAAMDPEVNDADFLAMVQEQVATMPAMMQELDTEALARALEKAMGSAYAQGIAAGYARGPNAQALP